MSREQTISNRWREETPDSHLYLFLTDIPTLLAQDLEDNKDKNSPKKKPVAEFKSTAVLPYVQGKSEPLCRYLEQQGIHTVFKSGMTLR